MSSSNFTTGSVIKYAILPRILPRAGNLFLSGFAQLAFLMAQVYRGVRLIPEGHPFLLPANIGRFNMRQVIAAAASNLQFRRENIDQIIVFVALMAGIVLLLAQAFILLSALFIPVAQAGMLLSFGTYFGTPDYTGTSQGQDLAFILLDRVFGVPGIFNSCVDTSTGDRPCMGTLPNLAFDPANPVYRPAEFPWPYHMGLHAMLQFYSVGLLVVATFIILYFVIVIIAETAQTGTPFGQRFNSVWAPLRLVVALGLLIPISNGLNSAQYITLYMAKFGSNFATNGWFQFNRGMTTAWGSAQAQQLIAKPQTPETDGLLQFIMLAHACKALEEGYMEVTVPAARAAGAPAVTCPEISNEDNGENITADNNSIYIDAYLVRFDFMGSNDARRMASTDWSAARDFFNRGDMTIRFGDRACANKSEMGRVMPVCGEIVIPAVNPSNDASEIGSTTLQATYYETVRHLWGEYNGTRGLNHWEKNEFCDPANAGPRFFQEDMVGDMEIRSKAIAFVQKNLCKTTQTATYDRRSPNLPIRTVPYTTNPGDYESMPGEDWGADIAKHYREGAGATTVAFPSAVGPNTAYTGARARSMFNESLSINSQTVYMDLIAENAIRQAVLTQTARIAAGDFNIPLDQLARGWAGAGMWYNHIARMNGSLTGATWNYPVPSRYPQIMEKVLAEVRQNNQNVTAQAQFTPHLGGKAKMDLPRGDNEVRSAQVLDEIYRYWGTSKTVQKPPSGNPILDFINALFGTKGLFSLDDPQNAQANPLALLSSLGKSLVEASIRNIGGATLAMAGSIITGVAKIPAGEQGFQAVSSFLFSIAASTLTAGIVLYYVLPFLPFIYFFFAVGNWMKGVFEAMVGVPLWALAHIRIDGNGLPGEAAMNGYYMLFEIFLRPILILFGLLASVTIFQAMATVLNGIWPIATKNLAGANYDLQSQAGWVQSVRGPVDQLFFTLMYAVILYIMALSSFKLIDLIPNQIMRWLGTAASTFSDMTGDAAQNLTQYSTLVGSQMTGQAIGGMKSLGEGAKGIGQGIANMGRSSP
jgi:hypothetical protein